MVEKRIRMGTDVAHLMLFHPDDLAHRRNDPIAWYGYDFAYRKESRQGRLIAWGTGADGGYELRLTTGLLTPAEEARVCASWAFPLAVRHGRVLVDNSDALPGAEQMTDPAAQTEAWFSLPNGNYRAIVHPIERLDDKAGELPDYVVTFEPVADLAEVPAARTPPELQPYQDWQPRESGSMETEARYLWRNEPLEGDVYPALVVREGEAVAPLISDTVPVSEEIADIALPKEGPGRWKTRLVVAAKAEIGAIAVVARVSGRSWTAGEGDRIQVSGLTLVRILDVQPGPVLPQARVAMVEKPDMDAAPADLEAFCARILAAKPAAVSSFEAERLETLTSAETVTTWALTLLPMPLSTRLRLWAAPARERMAGIERILG